MSHEQEVGVLLEKRNAVMPQMYFIAAFIIGLVCSIGLGIIFCLITNPTALKVGLVTGLITGFSFGAFKLNEAEMGGFAGSALGIGLSIVIGASALIFCILLSLGLVLGFGSGFLLRHIHYSGKKQNLQKTQVTHPAASPGASMGGTY